MPFPLLAIPAIASGLGAILGTIGKRKPEQFQQVQRYTPQQQQALNNVLQQAMGKLGQPMGEGFEPIAQQARTQFGQSTVPSIAERFSGLGPGIASAQRSSAFGQTLGQAGAGLEGQLAGQKAQFGQQEQQLLQQLLGLGLTPQFDTQYQPEKPGGLQQFGGALQGLGQLAGPFANYQSQNQLLNKI